jgi:hypothetical protein
MANISKSLRSKLLEASQLTALIGQRMYPNVMPQKATMPAIVYRKIATRRVHDNTDVTRLAASLIEFTCYASSQSVADDVAKAVRQSGIFGYRGTIDGVVFCGARIVGGDECDDEPPTDGSQVHRYLTRFDIEVDYKEAD